MKSSSLQDFYRAKYTLELVDFLPYPSVPELQVCTIASCLYGTGYQTQRFIYVRCDGLNINDYHKLMYLNTWYSVLGLNNWGSSLESIRRSKHVIGSIL